MGKNKIIFFTLYIILLLSSNCSLDYSSANVAEDLSEKIPETVFIEFSQYQVKNGKIATKIKAKRAENYTKKKEMVLQGVQFLELDDNGDILTEGNADKAVLYIETDDADIYGNIVFYSHTEKTKIFADTLFWKEKEEKLYAEPNAKVVLKKDDGSYIEGIGFSTDFRLKEIIFSGYVRGSYVQEDEQEEAGHSNDSMSEE